MIRKAFIMHLKPGCGDVYRQRHQPIWPELKAVLHDHGVSSYSIFLHPDGCQLFAYAEVEDEARWNAIGQTPICRKWWRWMSAIMETLKDLSPVTESCEEVFHIETPKT
ncbi:MAG: L-rhamnose mutarotase [Verrucomicrobiota bacterium]|jgi:L-rhamnose mutarotase|nr:L-rhamnose mutarotase [Verrucomicrobiota bacterium]